MTELPAAGTFSDPARLNAEAKFAQDQLLGVVGELLGGAAPTVLGIAAGAIEPTRAAHLVATFAGQAADTLDRIGIETHPLGRTLLLLPADPARVVTVAHDPVGIAEGIWLHEGRDAQLGPEGSWLWLRREASGWREITRRSGLGLDLAATPAEARERLQIQTGATVNLIDNGDMRVARRNVGYDPTPGVASYGACDRFYFFQQGGQQGDYRVQQGDANGESHVFLRSDSTTPLPGLQRFGQVIETANCAHLAGRLVTLSFEVDTIGAFPNDLNVVISTGTGEDEGAQAVETGGWTSGSSPLAETIPAAGLSNDWQTFSYSVTLPIQTREIAVAWNWVDPPGGSVGLRFRNVQLVEGGAVGPFQRRPIAQEIAAAGRDAYVAQAEQGVGMPLGSGYARSSALAWIFVPFAPALRAAPTGLTVTNVGGLYLRRGGGTLNVQSLTFLEAGREGAVVEVAPTSASLAPGDGAILAHATITSRLIFTGSEL
ncbi:hypothetical protein [Algihabitans albus]|uniref:hypothetical protein n=1 Tax=Algihabitans albus TaxID=2164067 RepID=UPI000E5C6E02|nr:hypothetical protein [Algihabitans albus]